MTLRAGALAAFVFAFACSACGSSCGRGGGDGTSKEKRASLTHRDDVGALVLENGALGDAGSNAAPLVFAVHGRSDTPESFSDTFDQYRTRATLVFPRGTATYGEGFSWFELGATSSAEAITKGLTAARDALHERVTKIAKGRRYAIVGFSQGGFLAFAFAAKYPDEVACALPIAGMLPAPMRPRAPVRLPPVFAFHGVDDPRVSIAHDRETVAAFVAAGGTASLVEYPGVAHTTTAKERQDFYVALDTCLETLTKDAHALPSRP